VQYAEYGEWDDVVHEFKVLDNQGAAQPLDMEEMVEDIGYQEVAKTLTVTVDPQTSATTLTVTHTFSRSDIV